MKKRSLIKLFALILATALIPLGICLAIVADLGATGDAEPTGLEAQSFSMSEVTDYVRYTGVQMKLDEYAAIRLRYEINKQQIALANEQGAQVYIGLLYADPAVYAGELSVSMNRGGTFSPTDSAISHVAIYSNGQWGRDLEFHVDMSEEEEQIGFQLARVELDEFADSEELKMDYRVSLYVATKTAEGNTIKYLPYNDTLFGDSLGFAELAQYFVANGYEDSPILGDILTSADMKIAIQAGAEGGNAALALYSQLQTSMLKTDEPRAEVTASKNDYIALRSQVTGNMTRGDALSLSKELSVAKGELSLYAEVARAAFAQPHAQLLDLQNTNLSRREAIRTALEEQTTLDDAAINQIVESVVAEVEALTAEIAGSVAAGEAALAAAEELLADETALQPLYNSFTAKGTVSLNTTPVGNFLVVTDNANMDVALSLQETLFAHYGALVGVYSVDDAYTGNHTLLSAFPTISVGVTSENLVAGKASYALYGEGNKIYIEGTDKDAKLAGVTAFIGTHCAGRGIINSTISATSGSLLAKEVVPMFTTNLPTEFPEVTISSYDQVGVWEGYVQTVNEKPEEITVLERILPSNFAYSMALQVFVANNGNDTTGNGTIENPYASINRALLDVENRKGAVIWLRGGNYSAAELSAAHSGSSEAPLFISAYGDETVTVQAGKTLSANDFVPVAEATFASYGADLFNKFKAGNAANVYAYDLRRAGYTAADFADFASYENLPDVFVGDTFYHTARWPNIGENDANNRIENGRTFTYNTADGAKTVKQVGKVNFHLSPLYNDYKNATGSWKLYIDDTTYGNHVSQYANIRDNLWMLGSVTEEFANEPYHVRILQEDGEYIMADIPERYADGSIYGAYSDKSACAASKLFFYNMPEDLDATGEYLLDIEGLTLYVYGRPTEDVTISYTTEDLMTVNGSSHVIFNGIDFKFSAGNGVVLNDTDHVFVQESTMLGITNAGITLDNTYMSGSLYNSFADMHLSIDMSNLTDETFQNAIPTCNIIQNNTFGREGSVQDKIAGLYLHGGLGDVVSHNRFNDNGCSVEYQLDLIFEYNDIYRANQYGHDSGFFYAHFSTRGMHIRNNYAHDLNYVGYGVYLDDMTSGSYIYGNIISYAEDAYAVVTMYNGRGINIHNSQACVVHNNVLLNGYYGIVNQPTYAPTSIDGVKTGGYEYNGWERTSWDFVQRSYNNTNNEFIKSRYPMWEYMNQFNERALASMRQQQAAGTWNVMGDKSSTNDYDEIMARSPIYNVYRQNVLWGQQSDATAMGVPAYWASQNTNENNKIGRVVDSIFPWNDVTIESFFPNIASGDYTVKNPPTGFDQDLIDRTVERAGLSD